MFFTCCETSVSVRICVPRLCCWQIGSTFWKSLLPPPSRYNGWHLFRADADGGSRRHLRCRYLSTMAAKPAMTRLDSHRHANCESQRIGSVKCFSLFHAPHGSYNIQRKYCTAVHSLLMWETHSSSQLLHENDTKQMNLKVASLVMAEGNPCLAACQRWGTIKPWDTKRAKMPPVLWQETVNTFRNNIKSNLKGKMEYIFFLLKHCTQQNLITTAWHGCSFTFSLNALIQYKITFCNVSYGIIIII